MKYIYKYTPEIIAVIYVLIFLGFKTPDRPWDRVINSDGKGYYAYLPALFIYHDLQFKFVEQYEAQYYPSNLSVFKEFRNDANGRKVDKYFPGMAILWFPFFLLGHLAAWLEKLPMDGYSLPYQYAIALSALFFLWMGARWLFRLLKKFGAGDGPAAFITFAMTLGTNLIFYTIVEGSMTHVYSFALITGFVYFAWKMFHEYRPKWFVKTLLLFTLIFLVRPTNALVILLIPFAAGSNPDLVSTCKRIISEKWTWIRGFIQAGILLAVPLVLWHMQTGKFLVYSYGGEKLSFFHPHILNILFSFNRGWLLYTPLALVSLFGFAGLFKQDRYRFYWLAGFLVIFVYVVSCWWVWYYASKCGQRVFVDLIPVMALLLMYLFTRLRTVRRKRIVTVLVILLVSLNILQFYQHALWIFPPYNITAKMYRDAFFTLHRKARVYIPNESVAGVKSFSNDLESEKDPMWMNQGTRNDTVFHQGHWSSKVWKRNPYSIGVETAIDPMFTTRNRIVRVTAWVLGPRDAAEPTLVVDYQAGGRSVSYNQFVLEKYVRVNHWTPVDVAIYVPANMPAQGTVKAYFYNPSHFYLFYVDDIKVDFVSVRDEPDYRKIEGILLPEQVR